MPQNFSSRQLYATASVVVLGVALGALLYRKRLSRLKHYSLRIPQIVVISSNEQWRAVADKFKASCAKKQVLGLDCEWKAQTEKGATRSNPVALLQLATPDKFCVLLRLNKLGNTIDSDLKSLLEDKSILKVGVAINDDSRKLMQDHGLLVEGCLDLRHLVDRVPKYAQLPRKGLKSLAENVTGITLRKSSRIRLSDWEAEQLTSDQIKYAAEDAVISVVIFNHLMKHMLLTWTQRLITKELHPQRIHEGALNIVGHLVDHKYRASVSPAKANLTLRSEIPSKRQTRAYSTRQTPLYHNCQLHAPDGEPLCTCDTKKAMWYLERDLAVMVQEDPLIVRLKFEPCARPILDNKYYVEEKENKCVVCGRQDSLVRKVIIPHEYRRSFPQLMKKHLCHDVLLLCLECHIVSNMKDGQLRQQLAVECNAPLGNKAQAKVKEDPQLRKVKSAGKALRLASNKMPEKRKDELINILKDFYQVSDITDPLIQVAADIETNVENEKFVAHGRKVVEHASSHGGLLAFETRWRKHFLDSMKPRFLPKMWSIDHNHQRLAMQVTEKKNLEFDVNILGPLPSLRT